MSSEQKAKNPIKATKTTFRIVETLKEADGAGVTQIANTLNIPKSSAHSYLSTLAEDGYVVKTGDTYRVGLRFLDLGGFARQKYPAFKMAKPEIEKLAEETGELASLLVEEHGMGVYLYRKTGEQAVNVDARTGHRVHLHNTSLGKAILAHRPEEEAHQILDQHGLPKDTEHTITDREVLFEELAAIRERRFALDHGERLPGLRCVGVPLSDKDDRVIGAISVSAPKSRMDGDRFRETIPELLESAANVIELNLAYS